MTAGGDARAGDGAPAGGDARAEAGAPAGADALAPEIAALLDPDRAVAEGAALGQLAARLPGGGLLITASRLVEFGCRAAILLAPGLFRLDLTPQEETLGLYPRPLGPYGVDWRAGEETWDGYRDPKGPAPMELAGRFGTPGTPLVAWIHILSFTERDALATHFVAKCEIRPQKPAD
jgi:hypothetical protein